MRAGRTLLCALLLTALALGLWGFGALGQYLSRETAAVCCAVTRELFLSGDGIFSREELPLCPETAWCVLTVPDGERVRQGQCVGCMWNTEEERRAVLARADAALSREQSLLRAVGVTHPASLPPDIAQRRCALALQRRDAAALLPALRELCAGVWDEPLSLPAAPVFGTDGFLLAPAGGILITGSDGYAAPETEPPVPGRIYVGAQWYFTAALPPEAAGVLAPGQTVTLDFSPAAEPKSAEVISLAAPADGVLTVRFLCREAPGDTAHLLRAPVRVVYGRISGLSLPADALREDENGTFVLRLTAFGVERADAEVLWRDGDEVLLRSDGLRPGSRVQNENSSVHWRKKGV